jgi:hypothetical protein
MRGRMCRKETVLARMQLMVNRKPNIRAVVKSDDTERKKDEAWATLCESERWVCLVCGAVPPERGKRFEGEICDDCRLIARNE